MWSLPPISVLGSPALASAIQRRIVLRMASADDYGMLDVPPDILSSDSPQGRGIYDGREVQVAVLGEASDAQGQAINLRRFAGSMVRAGVRPAPAVLSLAEKVNLADLPVVPGRLVIGIDSELLSALRHRRPRHLHHCRAAW